LRLEFPLDHEQITNSYAGVPGLGYVFFPGYARIRPKTYKRMAVKLKERLGAYNLGKASLKSLNSSWQSFRGILGYGNNLRCKENLLRMLAVHQIETFYKGSNNV